MPAQQLSTIIRETTHERANLIAFIKGLIAGHDEHEGCAPIGNVEFNVLLSLVVLAASAFGFIVHVL